MAACGSDSKSSSDTAAPGGNHCPGRHRSTGRNHCSGRHRQHRAQPPLRRGDSILNGEIKCEQQYAGKEVHIFSPVVDSENDHPIADFVAAYQPLVDCTGVKIVWEGTKTSRPRATSASKVATPPT